MIRFISGFGRVLLLFAACFSSLVSGQIVLAPITSPAAIVANNPTSVIVRIFVTPTPGHSVLANSVNVLQVDANGANPRILGTLNDVGVNGDMVAGDGFFGGTLTLTGTTVGQIYIQVSVAFSGSLHRTLSPMAQLPVTPVNIPNTPYVPNVSQTVINPATGSTVICNELLVTFYPSVSPADVVSILAANGGQIVGMIPALGIYQAGLPSCSVVAITSMQSSLLSDPRVQSAEFDTLSATPQQVTSNPNDHYFALGYQWYLTAINMPVAWGIAKTLGILSSSTIGIVDTGINANHEDLLGEVLSGINWCPSVDNVGNCSFPNVVTTDDNGHGTAVAGLAAAVSNNAVGVASPAFKALIIPEKIDYRDNKGKVAFGGVSVESAAIYDAIFNGARVINLSFGTVDTEPQLGSIIAYALSQNVVIVAAAGNYLNSNPFYPAKFSLNYPNVISVGATDRNNALSHWTDSNGNFCDASEIGSNYGPTVSVYAPGSEMSTLSYNNNSAYNNVSNPPDPCSGNGTSFATPLVTGTIALMLKVNPLLMAAQVKAIIQGTASITGHQDPDGNPISLLNAGAAMLSALTPPAITDGTVTVVASLDGAPWPISGSGILTYTLTCGNETLTGSSVSQVFPNETPGACNIYDISGGPLAATLGSITPAVSQTLISGEAITYTLNYTSNNPHSTPVAGFRMSSGTQSALSALPGQPIGRLGVAVQPGQTATVTFDGSPPTSYEAIGSGTINSWTWSVDGVVVSQTKSFSWELSPGPHTISLSVGDSNGSVSLTTNSIVTVYQLYEIMPLPGDNTTLLTAINNDGTAIGVSYVNGGISHGITWTASAGSTPFPFLYTPWAINDEGHVVTSTTEGQTIIYGDGSILFTIPIGLPSFIPSWINNSDQVTLSSLGELLLYKNGEISEPYPGIMPGGYGGIFVNDLGEIGGSAFINGSSVGEAFLIEDGQFVEVGRLPAINCTRSYGVSLNNVGQLLVWCVDDAQAYIYRRGVVINLGLSPGKGPVGVNDNGDALLSLGSSGGLHVVFSDGSIEDLTNILPGNLANPGGTAINRLGQIVGGWSDGSSDFSFVLSPR